MSIKSLQAESGHDEVGGSALRRPLLSGNDVDGDEEDVDNDEEIMSQLLSSSDRSSRRRRLRCDTCSRGLICVLLFTIFTLMGLFASVWATTSCNLLEVHWNTGGVQLVITGVGYWSYQQEVIQQNKGGNDVQSTKEICVDYGSKPLPQQADMTHFFPSNNTLQAFSIVGPSLYFAAILAMLIFIMIISMHPERYMNIQSTGDNNFQRHKGAIAAAAIISILMVLSGIFQILSVHDLLDSSNNNIHNQSSSPFCNTTYSTCNMGTGGYWSVFAIVSSFTLSAVASCVALYFVGCRARHCCFIRR